MAEDPDFPLSRAEAVERVARYLIDPPRSGSKPASLVSALATGLGASPGLASGEIVTSPDAAVVMTEEGRRVILVRPQTSPDDVHGMARAVGILTTSGGLASHAAVVARGWGIPAVVGASAVRIEGDRVTIGDRVFSAGDVITIDGNSGEVSAGAVSVDVHIVPEAEKLLEWARELGVALVKPDEPLAPASTTVGSTSSTDSPAIGNVVRALLVKGFATPDNLAPALFTSPTETEAILNRMTADGLAELIGGMFQLSADGKTLGHEMISEDRRTWGDQKAAGALESLEPFDQRMKVVVTRWQMREFKGKQILNDHTDADHDAVVLEAFDGLHSEASEWLRSLSAGLPRLAEYATRLERAAQLVGGGDHGYLASPRVDSYHNIWFELHEDLIMLAGRTREEEVAAGRA
jgi:pyruvate,orthophosphate dikinase